MRGAQESGSSCVLALPDVLYFLTCRYWQSAGTGKVLVPASAGTGKVPVLAKCWYRQGAGMARCFLLCAGFQKVEVERSSAFVVLRTHACKFDLYFVTEMRPLKRTVVGAHFADRLCLFSGLTAD